MPNNSYVFNKREDGGRYTTLRVDAYRLRYLASFVVSDRRIANMPPLADDIQGWRLDFIGRGRHAVHYRVMQNYIKLLYGVDLTSLPPWGRCHIVTDEVA